MAKKDETQATDEVVETPTEEVATKPNGNMGTVLKDKVQLKVGIVGCGNAGNQLVEAAYNAGFRNVFIVNTSRKDMDDQLISGKIPGFLIGNAGQGAGSSRSTAKELFKMNYRELFDKSTFREVCENSDIIFVGASCSGGTGSGVSPVITSALKQMYPGKIIIFYGILPRISGSDTELSNSCTCVNEIEDLNAKKKLGIPYMLANLNYYEGVSNEIAYAKVIEKMVTDIEVIAGRFLHYSKYRMIDENDTRVVISAAGYMSIYMIDNITQQMIDKENIQQMLIKQIKNSPACPIARDGLLEQMAIISNLPSDMADSSKAGDYEEVIKYVGRPLTIFENYAIIPGGTGQVIAIFSGQSYPVGHMTNIDNVAKEGARIRKEKLEARKSYSAESTSTYEFIQSSGSNTADLLGKTGEADDRTKKQILDNLF